ncbi:hypothetical protein D1832_11300 [Dermacoccus abyssi]|uniref:Glutaredoxin domain-containing protein n=1 Tax=Dermacoccus abyssi TaxID=322596 RepID=A0A417Z3T2_9MICO|nr:glutaredoxin domain-containing protein [Dermacoccus abyssi]RHW44830.1 hypothetical protein D1832_11300 [Dermacoccus abyssi]
MSDVTIYWRPGCVFCMRLENALGASRNKATWRNIWEDDEAREFVAMVNDGNEIVPTVVIDAAPTPTPTPCSWRVLSRADDLPARPAFGAWLRETSARRHRAGSTHDDHLE